MDYITMDYITMEYITMDWCNKIYTQIHDAVQKAYLAQTLQ